MPAGWVLQTLDLIFWGCSYPNVHKVKDAQSQITPGRRHRDVCHDWYQSFGKLWDFSKPFPDWLQERIRQLGEIKGPDTAETEQASLSHDFIDRTWDGLSKEKRKYWEGFFAWLVYRPDLLRTWAGVDVSEGKIHRTIGGQEVWEDSPETVHNYRRLRREVSRHVKSKVQAELIGVGLVAEAAELEESARNRRHRPRI